MLSPLLLLCHLWSLVEVNSQTVPYVKFMSKTLLNHAYVDLRLVGNHSSGRNSVQCHTDLKTCCGSAQDKEGGNHHGNWIPPGSDSGLPFSNEASGDIYEVHGDQRVELRRRNNADMPSGIYRCDIPINAVHDDDDITVTEWSHLVVEPSIEWTRQDGTVVNTSTGSTLQLDFNPLHPSNSGHYTCRASIDIADIASVSGENSRNLLLASEMYMIFIASHFFILYGAYLDTESESSSTVFVIGGIVLAVLLITSVAVAVVAVILTVKNYCRNAFVNKTDR